MGKENGNEQTTYVVLARASLATPDEFERWELLKVVDAPSAARARGIVAEELEREDEAVVAVPKRSWKPEPVKLERTPRAIVGSR